MNKALLLSSLLLSMAYSEEQSLSLDVFGFSDHSNKGAHYNQSNAGEGLTYSYEVVPEDHTQIIVSTGTYKDSNDNRATYAVIGPQFLVIGEPKSFNVKFSISAGYYEGSCWHGFGIVPVLSFGYSQFNLCFTGVYAKDRNAYNADGSISKDNSSTSMIAIFAEIKLLTW